MRLAVDRLRAEVVAAERFDGLEDGRVAGAAAQVPVKGALKLDILDRQLALVRGIPQHRIDAHDDSWRAEAALRAVELPHALLEWVRVVGVADSFDGDDMLAFEDEERGEAGVNGEVLDCEREK